MTKFTATYSTPNGSRRQAVKLHGKAESVAVKPEKRFARPAWLLEHAKFVKSSDVKKLFG